MEPMEINPLTKFDAFVAEPDTEVTDQLILTSQQHNPTNDTTEPALAQIFEADIQLTQREDRFCVDIRQPFGREKAYNLL